MILLAVVLAPSWRNYYRHRSTVRIIEDQVYVPGSVNPKHQLDLYLPTTGTRPWPTVVFVHGGFWKAMDRRLLQPFTGLHGCVGVALANRGVATAVVSYRQYPEATTIQDALDDVARAVRFVMDNIGKQGGDPTRVFIVGHSAGGLMTMLLAVTPDHLEHAGVAKGQVRGFASLAGVYDLDRIMLGLDSEVAVRVRRSAGNDRGLERFSPSRLVRPDHPAMLLLVGSKEPPFMLEEYRQMTTALRRAGGEVSNVEIPGADHMDLVMHLSNKNDRTLSELIRFIERFPSRPSPS
jgi:acetyl esterase/lipase